ncbi:MAG TPA: hypothetical protein PLA50_06135 [Bacteroidia bacterium]|nr:hypothetical protein [Bacteroidia bacterium]
MPDSWIDKEELEELVGRFSVGRKGRRRKPSGNAGPRRPERTLEAEPTEEVKPAEAAEPIEEPIEVAAQTEPAWPATIFELDLGDEEEDDEEWEDVPVPLEEADAPSGENFEPEPEVSVVFEEVEADAVVPMEDGPAMPAVIVELPEAETLDREVPEFLDDSDEFLHPRGGAGLERDADRALVALADARAKADKSQLLRLIGSKSDNAETDPEPEIVIEEEEDEEMDAAPLFPDLIEEAVEEETEEAEAELPPPPAPEPPAPASIEDRISRFGEWLRDRLGGTEIAVCDANGLLLYADDAGAGADALDTALLLDASGRTNRLLGIENPGMVQVTLGGGAWRCLLRGDTGRGPVYAGFKLRRPLERDEVEYWSQALADALAPAPTPV